MACPAKIHCPSHGVLPAFTDARLCLAHSSSSDAAKPIEVLPDSSLANTGVYLQEIRNKLLPVDNVFSLLDKQEDRPACFFSLSVMLSVVRSDTARNWTRLKTGKTKFLLRRKGAQLRYPSVCLCNSLV